MLHLKGAATASGFNEVFAVEEKTPLWFPQPHPAPGRETISQACQEMMETRNNFPPSSEELGLVFPLLVSSEGTHRGPL